MKQHITPKQAKQLTEEEFYRLFDEVVPRKDWANYHHKKVTIGKLTEIIRSYCLMELVSTRDGWHVQLYKIIENTTDNESPIYVMNGKELIDVLFHTLLWVLEKEQKLDDCLLNALLGIQGR